MEEKRYLGIDFGRRRVGIAISDPGGLIARPMETLIVNGPNDALRQVLALVTEYAVVGIVLGWPITLAGDISEAAQEIERFAKKLRAATAVPVFLEDERFSSRQAEAVLHAQGKRIKGNKEKIDRISAAIILQSFLDRQNNSLSSNQT